METKTYSHGDGGTFTVVASFETKNRWRITITRWVTYRNTVVFEVHRETPKGVLFRLAQTGTEAEARTVANRKWLDETGRGVNRWIA